MRQLPVRWTLAEIQARIYLIDARLTISVARGLGSLGLLTPAGARLAFRVSSRLDHASMLLWRRRDPQPLRVDLAAGRGVYDRFGDPPP
jgi:hypothetical protein